MTSSLFGTDGIRGTVGNAPFTLEQLPRLGKAVAAWAMETYGPRPQILVGHDTRGSCSFIKAALQSGLLLHPVTIYDAQVLSTPALYYLTRSQGLFSCGIMISASHNPYHDNGIKLIDASGGKIASNDEQTITNLFATSSLHTINYGSLGTTHSWHEGVDRYIQHVISWFPPEMLAGKKIVLDFAHGATYMLAPRIFAALGATTIALHHEPNGMNINNNCGSLHPEALQQAVTAHNADIGFAFDGDGDRVIAVSRSGEIKDGDDMLALLLAHPHYKETKTVVGTEMTNQGFELYLRERGKELIRTRVGDKYVAQRLEADDLFIGGEPSGHIITRDYLNTGDGIFTALRLLESLTISNNWDMETFQKFPQILINIPIRFKKDLGTSPIAEIIDATHAQLQSGRVVVRYSGTEDVLRIMVEDRELSDVQRLSSYLSQALAQELSTI